MKTIYFIAFILISILVHSQKINVKDYGAKGDGKSDETISFQKALNEINDKYASAKIHTFLYIPSGTYILSESLILNKYISIIGEFTNSSILKTYKSDIPIIILEKNIKEDQIYNGYNYVKNLTISGPESDILYSADRKHNRGINNSIGVKVLGLRSRLEDLQIEGFTSKGIEISGAYYTSLKNCFIINNAIGILIDQTSTSAFVNNNELRHNSIGIVISNGSFGNFISDNIIESNVGTYLPNDPTFDNRNTYSSGKGILLHGSFSSVINNNYFENHFVNITFNNTEKNNVNNNFVAISEYTLNKTESQIFFQMVNFSKDNLINNNTNTITNPKLDPFRAIYGNEDYSSNIISRENSSSTLKAEVLKSSKKRAHLPQISN